jgi:tetratricopeptide (TPR) repeat protein
MAKAYRVALILLLVASTAAAQAWRGQGHLSGKVTDEKGQPIEGVVVKLSLPGTTGEVEQKTDKKGEWAVGGIGRGNWNIDFTKKGFETRHISAPVQEMNRMPTIETTMKKADDPNEIIAAGIKQGSDLVNQKKYPEARAVYEGLLAKYPQAYQLDQFVARTYYLEGQPAKAIEVLQAAVAKKPDVIELRLLLGSLLLEAGKADEGKQVLAAVDESKITDPALWVNFGITMMNKNQTAEAAAYFEKAIAKFPQAPDAYYYHGITLVQLASAQGQEAQKADRLAQAKADIQNFLQLAPTAPEAETAKKILEQLK